MKIVATLQMSNLICQSDSLPKSPNIFPVYITIMRQGRILANRLIFKGNTYEFGY